MEVLRAREERRHVWPERGARHGELKRRRALWRGAAVARDARKVAPQLCLVLGAPPREDQVPRTARETDRHLEVQRQIEARKTYGRDDRRLRAQHRTEVLRIREVGAPGNLPDVPHQRWRTCGCCASPGRGVKQLNCLSGRPPMFCGAFRQRRHCPFKGRDKRSGHCIRIQASHDLSSKMCDLPSLAREAVKGGRETIHDGANEHLIAEAGADLRSSWRVAHSKRERACCGVVSCTRVRARACGMGITKEGVWVRCRRVCVCVRVRVCSLGNGSSEYKHAKV
jgi:hypothetical protein